MRQDYEEHHQIYSDDALTMVDVHSNCILGQLRVRNLKLFKITITHGMKT